MKRINALRCTVLLAIASSLVLAGCAIKQPPFGADIMPESARSKIREVGPARIAVARGAELDSHFSGP